MPTLRRGSTRLDSPGLGRTQLDSLWLQLDWAPCWGSTRCWIQLIGNYTFWLVRNGNEVETKLCNRQGRQKVHGNFGPSLVRSGNLLGRLSKFIKNQWASADALPGINNDWTSAAFSTSKYPVFPAKNRLSSFTLNFYRIGLSSLTNLRLKLEFQQSMPISLANLVFFTCWRV